MPSLHPGDLSFVLSELSFALGTRSLRHEFQPFAPSMQSFVKTTASLLPSGQSIHPGDQSFVPGTNPSCLEAVLRTWQLSFVPGSGPSQLFWPDKYGSTNKATKKGGVIEVIVEVEIEVWEKKTLPCHILGKCTGQISPNSQKAQINCPKHQSLLLHRTCTGLNTIMVYYTVNNQYLMNGLFSTNVQR